VPTHVLAVARPSTHRVRCAGLRKEPTPQRGGHQGGRTSRTGRADSLRGNWPTRSHLRQGPTTCAQAISGYRWLTGNRCRHSTPGRRFQPATTRCAHVSQGTHCGVGGRGHDGCACETRGHTCTGGQDRGVGTCKRDAPERTPPTQNVCVRHQKDGEGEGSRYS
jgi:hypothetical protein